MLVCLCMCAGLCVHVGPVYVRMYYASTYERNHILLDAAVEVSLSLLGYFSPSLRVCYSKFQYRPHNQGLDEE